MSLTVNTSLIWVKMFVPHSLPKQVNNWKFLTNLRPVFIFLWFEQVCWFSNKKSIWKAISIIWFIYYVLFLQARRANMTAFVSTRLVRSPAIAPKASRDQDARPTSTSANPLPVRTTVRVSTIPGHFVAFACPVSTREQELKKKKIPSFFID